METTENQEKLYKEDKTLKKDLQLSPKNFRQV